MTVTTSAADLLKCFLDCTEHSIVPKTSAGVSSGSKVFGAAIFRKDTLEPVMVETNHETSSPLLHGEINCIQQFYALPADKRPNAKDCIFFATHEPCSLCLSGITWGGFDNHFFLFTYEDTRDAFDIPYDIDILEQVFKVEAEGETNDAFAARPLYRKQNKFWTAKSVTDLLAEVPAGEEKAGLEQKVKDVKALYNSLSETYQASKGDAGIPLA